MVVSTAKISKGISSARPPSKRRIPQREARNGETVMESNTPDEKARPRLRRHAFNGHRPQAGISDWSAISELMYQGRGGHPESRCGKAGG